MKKTWVLLLTLTLSVSALAGCGSKKTVSLDKNNSSSNDIIATNLMQTRDDMDGDGIPDVGEKVLGTNPYAWDTDGDGIDDKDDKEPDFMENPIQETAKSAMPITIKDIRVEDNQTDDHLEITLCNTGMENFTDFDLYYTISDNKDGSVEGYYQKLSGFTLEKGNTKTLHFDNDMTKTEHFFQNMNGLYGTSSNGLVFKGQLHVASYKPIDFTVNKDEGTAEVKD